MLARRNPDLQSKNAKPTLRLRLLWVMLRLGHLMPGGVHSDINWDCPPVDTWSPSGLKKFGIERRQIFRDLKSPQMPSAAGSISSGSASACRKTSPTKWIALAQSLSSFAPLCFNEP
ncbi:unnamed protein product [Polarella glacialis]|uniref:Uncharacterized protein n=1 Tax=Polarella glacialis TaxID=89957 RepID=A0A813IVR3_POLGL|nr:unnamed protein product [Polarella glacialis]